MPMSLQRALEKLSTASLDSNKPLTLSAAEAVSLKVFISTLQNDLNKVRNAVPATADHKEETTLSAEAALSWVGKIQERIEDMQPNGVPYEARNATRPTTGYYIGFAAGKDAAIGALDRLTREVERATIAYENHSPSPQGNVVRHVGGKSRG